MEAEFVLVRAPCESRGAPDRHVIRFEAPVEFDPTGDRARDVPELTERCNAALESIIRRYPEQYMWGHRRFRRSPDLGLDPYSRHA